MKADRKKIAGMMEDKENKAQRLLVIYLHFKREDK
jgi:hypothetical protein